MLVIDRMDSPKRETLREQMVESLRDAVLGGSIPPGQKLVEAHIADQLGVSRGPLREAMRQLVEEGLLEHVPFRGTIVREVSLRDLEEIYSYRTHLESFAFKLVWPHRTQTFFDVLDARHTLLQGAIRSGDQQAAIQSEMDLHSTVYEFADHSIMLDAWRMLRRRIHFYFTVHQMAHGRSGALPDAHMKYVEFAKGQDLARMILEVEEHMRRGLDRVRTFVQERYGAKSSQ